LAKREVALYLPVVAELDGTIDTGAWKSKIEDCVARQDREGAARLISDDLLKLFALAGTPEELGAQAHALFAAGAARVEFGTPHGFSEQEGMKLLGEHVLPAFLK
jgi:5,10-methylenetetrahydromethanopterin reductase